MFRAVTVTLEKKFENTTSSFLLKVERATERQREKAIEAYIKRERGRGRNRDRQAQRQRQKATSSLHRPQISLQSRLILNF